jgi:hypothetical protein
VSQQVLLWRSHEGPQTAFLASTAREVLYGGAAGGGKTDALIALALRWVDHPKHRCLMLRRTSPDLQEVIDRTLQLYPEVVPGAEWREAEHRWKFPSGAMIQMGHAEHENDIYRYKSFEYNLICFDELTSFTEKQYLFMFLRNRTKSIELPPLIRSATNPGDVGHEWVKRRFLDKRTPYKVYNESVKIDGKDHVIPRQYIPSRVWDNPSLPNRDEYIAGIMQLSPEDVAAYLYGEWDKLAGAMFQPLMIAQMNDLADKDYFVVRSIDFGIYDPTCVLWLVHYPKSGLTDVVSELYMKEASLDEVAKAIKAREVAMGLRPPVYSVGSPEMFNKQATSNQSIATMLGALGVYLEKGNTDLTAGWARLRTLQQRNAIRVWPGGDDEKWGAPNLCRTLPNLQRDTGVNKDPNRLRPRQEDHAADALRYGEMVIYERPEVLSKPDPVPDDPNRDNVFDKMMTDIRKSSKKLYIPELGTWDF